MNVLDAGGDARREQVYYQISPVGTIESQA
jgi:hypothetical protein